MALIEEHIKTGNWLFKYRSYLPILMFILYFIGLYQEQTSPLFQSTNWIIFCYCISTLGQIIRILTIAKVPTGTSGRNTKKQRATSVNKLGIYSTVRHPLYLGNYFMWLGMFMLIPILWVQVLFSLIYWIYYERIMIAEENFLQNKFGNDYSDWAEKEPAFIPSFKNYKKNPANYNMRNIIRREYTSLSAMILLFLILIQLNNGIAFNDWEINPQIKWIFIVTAIIYLLLRLLKKNTKLFR